MYAYRSNGRTLSTAGIRSSNFSAESSRRPSRRLLRPITVAVLVLGLARVAAATDCSDIPAQLAAMREADQALRAQLIGKELPEAPTDPAAARHVAGSNPFSASLR